VKENSYGVISALKQVVLDFVVKNLDDAFALYLRVGNFEGDF